MLKLYQIMDSGEKVEILNFKISSKDVESFNKRPAVFKNYSSGYELTWQGQKYNSN